MQEETERRKVRKQQLRHCRDQMHLQTQKEHFYTHLREIIGTSLK